MSRWTEWMQIVDRPLLSACNCLQHPVAVSWDCFDWFREIRTNYRIFPNSRMIISAARPFSSADTVLWK